MAISVGMDVHKADVVVAMPGVPTRTVSRTLTAIRRLADDLQEVGPGWIIVEPTAGYERLVVETLQDHDLPVILVPGQQIRAYARSLGIGAKTDRIDAQVLARYGAERQPAISEPRRAQQRALVALVERRRHYVAVRAEQRVWVQQVPGGPDARDTTLEQALSQLIAELDREIQAVVAHDPTFRQEQDILVSCPGIGPQTAVTVLASLPELGHRTGKQIASLVGVAPITTESGGQRGTARVRGGRAALRQALWLPTGTAMRCNPQIAAFAARLRAAGKAPRVIWIACMHKLLGILNAMLATRTPYAPPAHP